MLTLVEKIQGTSLLVMAVCALWVAADSRNADSLSTWYMAAVLLPWILAAVVFVIATLIRIWF